MNYYRFRFNIVCVMIVKMLLTSKSRPLTVGLHNSNVTKCQNTVRDFKGTYQIQNRQNWLAGPDISKITLGIFSKYSLKPTTEVHNI